jgi:hypothetical protein
VFDFLRLGEQAMKEYWNAADAVQLCSDIELFAPEAGCHVALTGGTLYKCNDRKDVDIMFYRIRQVDKIDEEKLFALLQERLGFVMGKRWGWVQKATYRGKDVDLLFPDYVDVPGEFETQSSADGSHYQRKQHR